MRAWRAKDREAFTLASERFLNLIRDVDRLLATRPEYLLGRWLEDAKRWGKTPEERARLEWNARRVITMWGDRQLIRDYSRREWSGMLNGFYLKRWEKFFNALDSTIATPGAFDQKTFDEALQKWERDWAAQRESYPTTPAGDSIEVSRVLLEKYQPALVRASGK